MYVVDGDCLEYNKGRIIIEKTFESLAKTVSVSCEDTLSELYSRVEQ